jgi:hypothetical protein
MKLKFIHPPQPEYNKERLYRTALRIALSELVLNSDYPTMAAARISIIAKAKSKLKH